MKSTATLLFAAFLATCLSASSGAKEGKFNPTISIGEKAPDFSRLLGIDEKVVAACD
jgi:hypothetical protein